MKKIAFITPSDSAPGFRLTGAAQSVADAKQAEELFCKIRNEHDFGLIIVDERLLGALTEERLSELEQGWHGLHLIMPSPVEPPAEVEDYASRLIRRAIGYHVRVKL